MKLLEENMEEVLAQHAANPIAWSPDDGTEKLLED